MQTQHPQINSEALNEKNSLHAIVKKILEYLTPTAVERSSVIINDIPSALMVDADQHVLSSLLQIVLGKMIMQGKDTCYRLSARQYTNLVLLHVTNTGSRSELQNKFYAEETHALCQALGGCISLNEFHSHSTSLTFSFRNNSTAA
jgi:hypothetical protein